jgi:hypothetical protein
VHKTRPLARRFGALLALLIVVAPLTAQADEIEGTVISLQLTEVVVDLGATKGVEVDDMLDVWRPLVVKHPVTGQVIRDRYRIGRLRVTQVRPNIAVARLEGEPEHTVAAGDTVVAAKRRPPAAPSSAPSSAPASTPAAAPAAQRPPEVRAPGKGPSAPPRPVTPVPSADGDAKELDALFTSLLGMPLALRIASYERWVTEHPRNRHARVLTDEAIVLRRLVDSEAAARRAPTPHLVSFAPPQAAPAGAPLRLAIEIAKTRGSVFHLRREGEPGFVSVPMVDIGAGYFATTLPASAMAAGKLEYFVESTDPTGERSYEIAGTAATPLEMQVDDAAPADTRTVSVVTASALTDYASFNGKKANDYVWQSEATLGVRFSDLGLRALRSGFGAYRGKGGTLEDLEVRHLDPRAVGLTYGYLEVEIGLLTSFSIAARAIVGLREDGVSGGAQGFFRIGNDRKTNLLLGGEVLGGIGIRGITQLEWPALPRIPIVLRTEVTNQPAGVSASAGAGPATSTGQGQVGIRSIVQVGYRIVPRLVVAARGSFQARTINHAGPGAGAAVIYEW